MGFKYSEQPYSLLQILLFSYDSINDTYAGDPENGDAPYELPAGNQFDVEPQADTDEMRGYGKVIDGLAVSTHADITIGTGGYPYRALAIMEGATVGYNAGGTVRELDNQAGGEGAPYFAAVGVAPSRGGGVFVAALPKIQLQAELNYSLNGEENAYVAQEAPARAFARNNRFHKRRYYLDLDEWVADIPADGASFKTWLDTIYSGSGS